jgi:8-oxo-dGTP pyrophosphatase MutT (NUDIX family)
VLQRNFQNLRQRQESAQIKAMKYSAPTPRAPHLTQVAALPMKVDDAGIVRVLLLTSRQTRRWVIPKGWPMKGRTPWQAAARETEEEAGLVGRPQKTPIGSYSYFKRRAAHFDVCQVDVYILEVEKKLKHWREKGQREARWVTIEEAASLVQEPGLIAIFRRLLSDQTEGSSGRVTAGQITTSLDRVNPSA